jgi:hypothetical protein
METTVTNQNDIRGEIKRRLNLGNTATIQFRNLCFPVFYLKTLSLKHKYLLFWLLSGCETGLSLQGMDINSVWT